MNQFNTLLMVFLTVLFNQDDFLVKQDDVTVRLSELDAYVFSMDGMSRTLFSENNKSIENSVLTLLNVNIVNQYINQSSLKDLKVFKNIDNLEYEFVDNEVVDFANTFDLDVEKVKASYIEYDLKTKYFQAMLQHLKDQSAEKVTPLAKEHYMINKKDFRIPEKRDLSIIVLPNDVEKRTTYISLMNELKDQSMDYFNRKAMELSVDSSTDSNKGNWGQFRKNDFNYPFNQSVFAADEGVIPQLFEHDNKLYIVRVNDIIPEKLRAFSEVKEQIIEKIQGQAVSKEFQNIINQKAIHKIEINAELVAQIFERYKIFNRK